MPDVETDTPPTAARGSACPHCGSAVSGQGSFCPYCGGLVKGSSGRPEGATPIPDWHIGPQPVGYGYHRSRGPVRPWRDFGRMLSAMMMVSFGVYLVLCLFVLLYGIDIVYPELENRAFEQYIVLIGVSSLVTISGAALQGWYLMLIGAIVASAIWLAVSSRRRFLRELTMKGEARNHSPFFDMCGLMFMYLFINALIVLALMAAGHDPTDWIEERETWELLFLLANASVWEEVITRVLLVGLPLIAVDALRRQSRKPWRYLIGGGIGIGKPEVVLVLLSSAAFGLGHLEGWGAWKVFPSGLAGVVLGYLFLKHGLAAAIMLHFSIDYMSAPLMVFEDSLALEGVFQIGFLLWLGVGMVFTVYYSMRAVEFLSGRRFFDPPRRLQTAAAALPQRPPSSYETDMPNEPPRPPPGTQTREVGERPSEYLPGFGQGFVCPVCHSTTARWLTGRLQCMGCGRIFE